MIHASELYGRIDINTDLLEQHITILHSVAARLRFQLSLDTLVASGLEHIIPSTEVGINGDEVIPTLALDVFRLFYTACVEHLLDVLEFRVLSYEVIRK